MPHFDKPASRSGVLRWAGLLASLLLLTPFAMAVASTGVDLVIDGSLHIRAADVRPFEHGLWQVRLLQAPNDPLILPPERLRCRPGAGCPLKLATQTVDPPPAQGFEIQGSNTIGEKLMPELVTVYLKKTFGLETEETPLSDPVEKELSFAAAGGAPVQIVIKAHGSSTGFEPLVGINAPPTSMIWMASRRVKEEERIAARTKWALDLRDAGNEHVIAVDGLGIIVNNHNPVAGLSIDEIAAIFSGRLTKWQDIKSAQDSTGNPLMRGEIHVYRRDDASGTTATFNDLVFTPISNKDAGLKPCVAARDNNAGACFALSAKKYESSEDLESDVANDPLGIGYIGIGYRQNTKALGIVEECAADPSGAVQRFAYSPSEFNIKTEEYPLARRLYLYTLGEPRNELAKGLVAFAQSSTARDTIRREGFIDQAISAANYDALGERFASMIGAPSSGDAATQSFLADIRFGLRLSTTLRFADKAEALDSKAQADIAILAESLKTTYKDREFLIIGFSDQDPDAQRALQLSVQRAAAVAKALGEAGVKVYQDNARAYGSAAPVACNDSEAGRALNRRVEVWIK